MPRDGNGVYSKPAGIDATPGTTIESADWNSFTGDVEQDLNTDRPIVAGGTGASTAVEGADNLSTVSTNIASATTTDLSTATGVNVTITGTTTITGFGTEQAGAHRYLTFSGALTLTHNATSLILPGAANITTAAGDTALAVSLGSGNWRVVRYTKADGKAVVAEVTLTGTQTLTNKTLTSPTINTPTISGGSWSGGTDLAIADGGTGASTAAAAFANLKQAASDTATGVVELATAAEVATGTDTGRVPSVSTMGSHQGVAKAWVNFNGTGTVAIRDSFNVSSITDNGTGDYTVNFSSAMANANYAISTAAGRGANAATGQANILSIAYANPTTSACRLSCRDGGNTIGDADYCCVSIFGD